jgi:nicotinate phosphoribosyltransferase
MPSLLTTDGYKFSMAEAGWPLRRETFYFALRRGGAQVVPFDAGALIQSMLPPAIEGEDAARDADYAYLAAHSYGMGEAFKAALGPRWRGELVVRAVPRGAVVLPREPVVTVTGSSALVSWLEPLLLQAHYRLQVATLALRDPEALARAVEKVTCARQQEIVWETCDAVGVAAPAMQVDSDGYVASVRERAARLATLAKDGARIFEVGLRAASSVEQHLLALEACKSGGVSRTSHVFGAQQLGMIPVGTMGHEHVQRYGSDEAAFRAMKERRAQRSSFLLDTFDTLRSGLPTALDIIAEDPGAHDSIRYDSGDKEAQYLAAVELSRARGLRPVHILEDGFDAEQLARFEALRERTGVRPDEQFYGFGGWLVAGGGLTRDRVAAVYKLSQTGKRATMKFSNDPGKRSIPGVPVVWRRRPADQADASASPRSLLDAHGDPPAVAFSDATRALERQLEEEARP